MPEQQYQARWIVNDERCEVSADLILADFLARNNGGMLCRLDGSVIHDYGF
jgi:hypothetical protein